MTKEEKIISFAEKAYNEMDVTEVLHYVLAYRLGFEKYDSLDNQTGNTLIKVVENYLVKNGWLIDFGMAGVCEGAYGLSKKGLKEIAKVMFSETTTLLDVELMHYC